MIVSLPLDRNLASMAMYHNAGSTRISHITSCAELPHNRAKALAYNNLIELGFSKDFAFASVYE